MTKLSRSFAKGLAAIGGGRDGLGSRSVLPTHPPAASTAVAARQQGNTVVARSPRYGCFGGVQGVILAAQQLGVVMSFLSSRIHRRHAALAGAASLLAIAFATPAFAQGAPAGAATT